MMNGMDNSSTSLSKVSSNIEVASDLSARKLWQRLDDG